MCRKVVGSRVRQLNGPQEKKSVQEKRDIVIHVVLHRRLSITKMILH